MLVLVEEVFFSRSGAESKEDIVEVLIEEMDGVLVLLEVVEAGAKAVLLSMVRKLLSHEGKEGVRVLEVPRLNLGDVDGLVPVVGGARELLPNEGNVGSSNLLVDEVGLFYLEFPGGEFGGGFVESLDGGLGYFGGDRWLSLLELSLLALRCWFVYC